MKIKKMELLMKTPMDYLKKHNQKNNISYTCLLFSFICLRVELKHKSK